MPQQLVDRRRTSEAALIEDVGQNLDDGDHPLIDRVVETARRATTSNPTERTLIGYLAVAMVAKRAIDHRQSAPQGIEELWAAARAQRERYRLTDPRVAPLEQLATYRMILTLAMERQLRLDAAMSSYAMWRQKYLDTMCRFPRAIEEFHTTLNALEAIEQDLKRWRGLTTDQDAHDILDILDRSLAEAFPPVRLMIKKSARFPR